MAESKHYCLGVRFTLVARRLELLIFTLSPEVALGFVAAPNLSRLRIDLWK